jgi:hypothetical protein
VEGLWKLRLAPTIWRACVDRIVGGADRDGAAAMLDEVAARYVERLTDVRTERSADWRSRLDAAHGVLGERPPGVAPHPQAVAELRSDLRDALTKSLGPVARQHAEDLLALLELERGVLRGRSVDLPLLDELFASGDERELRRAADRLPDAGLRAEARRRTIRLHIQASPHPEVRQRAAAVEEVVMAAGFNAVAVAQHPPVRGRIDDQALPARSVSVRQDFARQTASLLGIARERTKVSVLPTVPLRGVLWVDLEGFSRPVTLCAPPRELDPSPCLPAEAVTLGSPLVSLDRDGLLHFREALPTAEALPLAKAEQVKAPITVAARPLATLQWDLRFEATVPLFFEAPESPPAGVHLRIRVERAGDARVIYTVTDGPRRSFTVVEKADLASFRLISRGRPGATGNDGTRGTDGLMGSPGSSASCPASNGSDGGRGGDGGPGGDGGSGWAGGKGGNIVVELACRSGACDELQAIARHTIISEGGPGGPGGAGGPGGTGGPGGAGGNGTSCTDAEGNSSSLSGGLPGASGSNGDRGRDGLSGGNGAPGRVEVTVVE